MKFVKKNLKWITMVLVMIMIFGFASYKYFLMKKSNFKEDNAIVLEEKEKEATLLETKQEEVSWVSVDIKGAVMLPGVYEVEATKKVVDVVQLAGGFTEQADSSFINLAKRVEDEMVIIIYTADEVKKWLDQDNIAKVVDNQCICPVIKNDACINQKDTFLEDTQASNSNKVEKVNLNTASLEELQTLSGIGESKAKAIIAYREEVGLFEKIEDLMNVSGIGEALYEKVKDDITV